MNKKGQTISFEMIMWIPRLIFLIIVIIATTGIIFAFLVTTVSVGDVESHIYMHRLQFSPEGISKYDPDTKRVYTGIVEESKLTSNNLEAALKNSETEIGARFVNIKLENEEESTTYLNEQTYLNWQPIAIVTEADRKVEGTGRKFPNKEARYVYLSESQKPGKLETVVITPNE